MATITGTQDNETLVGTNDGDLIDGLGGNDTLLGDAGADNIVGGSGDDFIDGGAGDDFLGLVTGGLAGPDGLGNDTIFGGAGDDLYRMSIATDGADLVDLGVGSDVVVVFQTTSTTPNTPGGDPLQGRDVRLTFDSAAVGNGSGNAAAGGLAVSMQNEDNTGGLFGPMTRIDDEGTFFARGVVTTGGVPNPTFDFRFDVRDSSGAVIGLFTNVLLGTSGADRFDDTPLNPFTRVFGTLATPSGINGTPNGNLYANGGAGDDGIRGTNGNDRLEGGAGNDTLIGGAGSDIILGGAGNDRAELNASFEGGDSIDLGDGTDVVAVTRGTPGMVRLTFTSSGVGNGDVNDTDGAGNVRVQAENSDGTLDPFSAISRVEDENIIFVAEQGATFDVRDTGGAARGDNFQVVVLGSAGGDSQGVAADRVNQNYYFNGGGGNDTIRGANGADFLVGGAGDDTLVGGEGANTYLGGGGNDLALGGTGTDSADMGDGNDRAFGNAGNDTLMGGAGDDLLNGEAGDDVLNGNDGADLISGELGNDIILGGLGGDVLLGGLGDDILDGEEDGDLLFGGEGVDNLFGDLGNDTLNGEQGNDALNGEAGDDVMSGELGDDLLLGGVGNDVALGGAGADVLNGEAGNDFLFGETGSDVLSGELGDDVLVGGAGGDALVGGAGADTFRFTSADDSNASGRDLIVDFNAAEGDRIDLSAIDANSGTAGDQGFTFVSAFSNTSGQMTRVFDVNTGTTRFSGDVNGDGVADFSFDVTGDFSTTSTGFIL